LALFAGQFLLLFFAFTEGIPAGLASVPQQPQVFFTVTPAACLLRDLPDLRQDIGLGVALAGLVLIGLTTGADLKPAALALAMDAAFSWAVGNILVKRTSDVPMFPLMFWASLVPPISALLVSSFTISIRC